MLIFDTYIVDINNLEFYYGIDIKNSKCVTIF